MSLPEKTNSKGGRPPKIVKHPEIIDKLVEELKEGHPIGVAVKNAGISRKTYYDCLKKGRKARAMREEGSDQQVTPWDDHYIEFVERIDNAEADVQQTLYDRVERASKQDWRAAKFILTRRWPEEWSKKSTVRHEIEGGDVRFTLEVEDKRNKDPMSLDEAKEKYDVEPPGAGEGTYEMIEAEEGEDFEVIEEE